MKEQMEERLASLRSEFQAGQKLMAELDARQADLRTTLTRISGAILVLEELLGAESSRNVTRDVNGGVIPASTLGSKERVH